MLRFSLGALLLLQFICIKPAQAQTDYIVAGYYEDWSQYWTPSGNRQTFFPNMIDPSILTDVNFAFGIFGFVTKSVDPTNPHLTGDYTVQPVEWNDQSTLYPQIQALKQLNGKLRTFLSIGGWSFNDPNDPNNIGTYTYKLYSQMVSTSANRQQFIQSAITYAHQYGFDGIDIDWEYPGDLTRGGTEADFDNFLTFLQECQTAFKAANPTLLLTYASAAVVPSGVPEKYRNDPKTYFAWLAECSNYLDHFNLMAYDYHGAFDNPKITGVNAPLNKDTNPSSLLYIVETLKNYIDNGVPASKIVLGMPTYGRTFGDVTNLSSNPGPGNSFTGPGNPGPSTNSAGLLAYYEIADMTAKGTRTLGSDPTTDTAYIYNDAEQQWASCDTPDTILLKAQEALDQNLGGVMFWAIDMDEYAWSPKFPNIRKAYELLYPHSIDDGSNEIDDND